jgi:ribokinase
MDDLGERALDSLESEGIRVDLVRRVPGAASGVALIFVDDRGENSIAVASGANHELQPSDIEALRSVVQAGDVVLAQLEIPLDAVEAAVRVAADQQAVVILNPAPARLLPDRLLAGVSVITPNALELEHLTDVGSKDDDGLMRGAAALHERGIEHVLITLGARGAFVSSEGASERVPGFVVDAIDSTAAGDVFNGALAVALVEERSLREAVRFANAAAALSVTKMGAQASAPRRQEIEALLLTR